MKRRERGGMVRVEGPKPGTCENGRAIEMKRRTDWRMLVAALVTAVWAWGVAWAGDVPSRKALSRASAFAWALCDSQGAVALYECAGRAEGAGERAVEFRRLDEAKCNAPEVLVGDADIGGVAPHEKCVYFGEVAAGSRWMFALREVEKEALKSPVRLDVAFTAPDGTGGERYWVLRNGHGGGWRPRPGGGCLDGKEGASGLFFAANEAEWAELKGIAMLMGTKGWHWTETLPEGVVATEWGQDVWRCLGDAVDGLTPAKKKAAEWFGRVLAREKEEWSLGVYRALEDARAEELLDRNEFYREVMENPPFHRIPGQSPWRVLLRLEELMPGAPSLLYASTVLILQEEVMGGQFNPPPETQWVVALEKCTEGNRPRYEQYVLRGQTGPAEGGDYAVLGGPGGSDGKQDGPDGVACVRWVDGSWKVLAMKPPASLLDAEEVEDLRRLAAAAREGAVTPTEELATRWGREVAKAWEAGRALREERERAAGRDGP